jgi:twitching motility protein PilT
MDWQRILQAARSLGASDVHLSAGEVPWLRIDGKMRRWVHPHSPANLQTLQARSLLELLDTLRPGRLGAQHAYKDLNAEAGVRAGAETNNEFAFNHLDFAVSLEGLGRFRVNAYLQARGPAMALRLIPDSLPNLKTLGAPECVASWGRHAHGLVLMTGPTGSGKSTLLAALLHDINQHCEGHLLTLEDPIEYEHAPLQCLIHQREVGRDTPDFESGLRAALREDPDVILVGEMRDAATIRLALTAAETGHLVLSTLHTASAPQAVDRLVDAFSSHEKEAVRALFAENLIAVLAQTLCPQLGGVGRVAAHEIMVGTPAVKNLIREGKVSQLYSALQTGQAAGMQTLDQSLLRHFQSGQISADTLRLFSKFHPKAQSDGQSQA